MSSLFTFEYLKTFRLLFIATVFLLFHTTQQVCASSEVKYNVSTIAGGNPFNPSRVYGDGFHVSMACNIWIYHMVQTSDGTIYMSDSSAHVIRKVDGNNGTITLLAGNYYLPGSDGDGIAATSATLLNPKGMVINKNETWLYFVSGSNCVRRIDLSSGIITTIVGNCGKSGNVTSDNPKSVLFDNPLSIALSNDENSIFISDFSNKLIRKFDLTTNIITTIKTEVAANALLVDGNSMYVAIGEAGTTVVYNISNNYEDIALIVQLNAFPGGLFKKGDKLYIVQQVKGNVVAYNVASRPFIPLGEVASYMIKPYGVIVDKYDNVIVSENKFVVYNYTNVAERKLFSGSCNTKYFAGITNGQDTALGTSLSILPRYVSQNYFVTFQQMIFQLNSTSGIATFKAGNGATSQEFGIVEDGSLAYNSSLGTVFNSITEANGSEIYFSYGTTIAKIDKSSGKVVFIAGPTGGLTNYKNISTTANDLIGNGTSLYFSDRLSVQKINLLTNTVEVVYSSTSLNLGRLAIDPIDGNIVFSDRNCVIRKVTPNGETSILAGGNSCGDWNNVPSSLQFNVTDIEYLPNGDLIIAEYSTCRLLKLSRSTNTISLIRKHPVCSGLINRMSIGVHSNGELIASNVGEQAILKYVPYCEAGYILSSTGTECILYSINAKLESTLTYTDSSFQVSISVSNSVLADILSKAKCTIYLNNQPTLYGIKTYPTTLTFETKSTEGNYTVSIDHEINGVTYSTLVGTVKVLSYDKVLKESFLGSATAADVASVASNSDTYKKVADSSSVLSLVTNALAASDRNTSNLEETSKVTKALNVISSLSVATTSVISKVSSMVSEIATSLTKLSSSSLQSSSSIDTTVSQVLNTFSNIISSNIYDANSTEVIDNMLLVSSKASSVKDSIFSTSTSSFVVSVVRNANISTISNGNASIVTPNHLLKDGVSIASVNYLNVDKLARIFASSETKLTSNFTNVSEYLSNSTLVNIANPIDLKYIFNGNFMQVTELVNPIKLSFTVDNSTISSSNLEITCRYFNETISEWLDNGCTTQIDASSATVNCLCNHTTTFSAFVESKLNTKVDKDIAIAGIVLGSLLILFTIITLIGVISTHRKTPTKSRGIIPYLSLISILIELVFLFIVSNAILLSNNTRASSTVKYVSTFISCLFYCLAILNYTILNVRYLAFRYVYEIMAKLDEKKVDMTNDKRFKWIKFILTGKAFIVILNLVFSVIFITFYAIFLGLIASESISGTVYTDVMAGSIFAFVMTMSLIVCLVYLFDLYMEFSYAQLNTKLIAKDKKLLVNPIKNYFILNDNLGFRKEFIFFFISMIFFVISYGVGFSSLQQPSDTASAVIFAFDVLYNIMLIMSFGGCVSIISIYEHIRQKLYSKVEDNGDGDDFADSQMKEILLSPSLCEVFKQFAKTEHSLENIIFYQKLYPIFEKCNKGELPSNTELGKEFEDWKVTFIETNSPLEVNYSHITKKSFISIYESILKNERDEKEVKEVLSDMYCALTMNLDDTFSRFVLTEGFDKMNKLFELKEQMSSTLKLQE